VKGEHTLKVHKGTEKQSLILTRYHGEIDYSEDLALKAHALTEILNIRVIEELREKLGAIYGGGFYAQVAREPYARYTIGLQLPCGPENVDKLLRAADKEISVIKDKGPLKQDLDKVRSQWREQHRTALRENRYWRDKLEDILFWGKDRKTVLEYDAWVDKLTPADIRETARQLLNGKNRFVSILYPEA
jgi:zinc protease